MNANNYINWSLIKYATALSLLILFNYFLWSINSWQIIKFINLFIIFFTIIYFFVSREFKDYWYLKVIILLLIIICLGTPTTPTDSWFVYLFSGKVLFYESNLYVNYLDDNYLNVSNRPKLPAISYSLIKHRTKSKKKIFFLIKSLCVQYLYQS